MKPVTNNVANFGNFFNSIFLSTLCLLRKKYLLKMLFGRNGKFPSAWEIMIKTWGGEGGRGGSFAWGHEQNFLTHKCICSNLNTINLKLFCSHGRIYRFRKKFKKDSGELMSLGVHRNMTISDQQYVCLLFC